MPGTFKSLVWQRRSLGDSCQTENMAALLNSLFFVFKMSILPEYRVKYYDYIIKWCRGIYVTAHAKMSRLSVKTYSRFITYSNRAHSEQNDDTSMPSTFSLFPEIMTLRIVIMLKRSIARKTALK